jgi:hypothetical protein
MGQVYEFIKEKDGYRVRVSGLFGKSQGTATLQGNAVTLTIKNILVGSYTANLTLSDDKLVGTMKT